MEQIFEKASTTAAEIKSKTNLNPKIGIILGTGLGTLVNQIDIDLQLSYKEITHFPISTVKGHKGNLIIGHLGGKEVLALQGRFHYYEGYTMQELTFPIRVMQLLGITHLVVSNAAGGLNPDFEQGDIVLLSDHINLFPDNPLRGANDPRLGIRFPDMSNAYSIFYQNLTVKIASSLDIKIQKGIYAGLAGPNLETKAEYKYLHRIGADLVGMSTVPEVIVANHAGLDVIAFSVVSNVCYPLNKIKNTTIDDVLNAVNNTAPILAKLVLKLVEKI